jgi:hypothetical protein
MKQSSRIIDAYAFTFLSLAGNILTAVISIYPPYML